MLIAARLAEALVAVWLVLLLALFLAQRMILFRPDTTRPDLARAGVPLIRATTVTTADRLTLLAWYLPPATAADPVVLYLHGNAGHIGHRAWRLPAFAALGWGVMLLEYRGYGGNPGSPSEFGLRLDARAGLDALGAMGFPPDHILLWGESLGTGLAVGLAAEQSVAGVILESPYTSIAAIARSRYPFVPVKLLLQDPFDSLSRIGGLKAPLLVMHGARDRVVPVAMGRALFAAAPEPKVLWVCDTAGHDDLPEEGAFEHAASFAAAHTGFGHPRD